MATLNPIQETPNPVPNGQSGTITLTFQVSPGTPDKTASLQVFSAGALEQSATFTLQGHPAEATPVVAIGSSNQGWEIRTDQGTLTSLGGNKFALAY